MDWKKVCSYCFYFASNKGHVNMVLADAYFTHLAYCFYLQILYNFRRTVVTIQVFVRFPSPLVGFFFRFASHVTDKE